MNHIFGMDNATAPLPSSNLSQTAVFAPESCVWLLNKYSFDYRRHKSKWLLGLTFQLNDWQQDKQVMFFLT